MVDVNRGPRTVEDPGQDGWARAVDRFAAWLADFSPFYRALRVPMPVPPDAPARLAYFWRTVGWAPGIGLGRVDFLPTRELGRIAADRAFRRWLGAECFAPAMGLAEPTTRALWERLPRRCWVLGAETNASHRSLRVHGGTLYYVDEDAGDDPPLMMWNTADVDHDAGPVSPYAVTASSLTTLMCRTLAQIATLCGIDLAMPAPEPPGPFAPLAPHLRRLADGVWGTTGDDPTMIDRVIYRSARAYLDFLTGVPAHLLPSYPVHLNGIHGAHEFTVADPGPLSARRLAERGFTCTERDEDTLVAGCLDTIPVAGFFRRYLGRPNGIHFWVAAEDHRAFRDLLRRERIRVVHHGCVEPAHWWTEPDGATRRWVARLAEQAERAAAGRPAPRRRIRRVTPALTADPAEAAARAEETVVRAEAAALRAWILAACPGLELSTPERSVGEPRLVRALWQELGYTDEFEQLLGLPDRSSSERFMARRLTVYRLRGCELRRSSLPKRFRLLWISGDDDSLMLVTDEDGPAADPPILAVSADDGEVAPAHDLPFPSYLGWVGEHAAYYAARWQPNLEVRTEPTLAELGTQPYPRLAPSIRHLSPEVWACPNLHVPIPGETSVGAPRFRDLVAWLAQTTAVQRLELVGYDSRCTPYRYLELRRFTPPAGLREWRAPSGDGRCYAGYIDDVPIVVKVTERITLLYASHADHRRAEAIAAAAGWTGRPRRRRTPPTNQRPAG